PSGSSKSPASESTPPSRPRTRGQPAVAPLVAGHSRHCCPPSPRCRWMGLLGFLAQKQAIGSMLRQQSCGYLKSIVDEIGSGLAICAARCGKVVDGGYRQKNQQEC